jgi:hypothetical protein
LCRKIQSSAPSFPIGITDKTFELAEVWLQRYKYKKDNGFAAFVDDTQLTPSLETFYDGSTGKWYLVGGTGDAMEISGNIDDLRTVIQEGRIQKATKVS